MRPPIFARLEEIAKTKALAAKVENADVKAIMSYVEELEEDRIVSLGGDLSGPAHLQREIK